MLDKLIQDAEAARKRHVVQQAVGTATLAAAHAAIRRAIEQGETTGSVIKDALLLRSGYIDPAMLVQYEALDASLKGKAGQLVLLIYNKSVRTKHTFTGNGDRYAAVRFGILGVLTGEALAPKDTTDRKWLKLPVDEVAHLDHIIRKGLGISEDHFDMNWTTFVPPATQPKHELEAWECAPDVQIHVGTDAVTTHAWKQWLGRGFVGPDTILRGALLLGFDVPLSDKQKAPYTHAALRDQARLQSLWYEHIYRSGLLRDLRAAPSAKIPFAHPDWQDVVEPTDAEKLKSAEQDLMHKLEQLREKVERILKFPHGNIALELRDFRGHPAVQWGRDLLRAK